MSETLEIAASLDLKGLLCPLPVVKVSKQIGDIPVGHLIEAFATDPGVLADIPAWCKSTGHELAKMDREAGVFRFLIRRTK